MEATIGGTIAEAESKAVLLARAWECLLVVSMASPVVVAADEATTKQRKAAIEKQAAELMERFKAILPEMSMPFGEFRNVFVGRFAKLLREELPKAGA